jgi:hypothetical protein
MRWLETGKLWTRAILYPLHLMGNYKPPFPRLLAWEINFEPEELMRWYVEMERRRDLILHSPTPPMGEANPAHGNEALSWECGYCPFFQKVGGPCPGDTGRPAGFFPLDPSITTKAA